MTERLLTALSGIVVLGIGAQWLAWRLRIPSILLLLCTGFAVGPGMGWINPDQLFGDLLLPVVSLSVGLILFEGGLSLRFRELRKTWTSLVGLLTVGALLTWVLTAVAASQILDLPGSMALLLGAVLVVTGPTVIGPLLRHIRPTGRVGPVAKWEGIVIDPIGATLAVLVYEGLDAIRQADYGSATLNVLQGLGTTLLVGGLIGAACAGLLVLCLRRFWIPDYLQNPVTLMFVVVALAASNAWHHEAGLLAVTLMGVILANQRVVPMDRITEFKESLTVLLISALFILLSARVQLDDLTALGWRGPVFTLVMLLVVRPASVWAATIGSHLNRAERLFLAWFAPRGIVAASVASVFALRLGDSGAAMVPATFLVIIVTVAVYGLTAGPLARRLGLTLGDPQGLLIAGANRFAQNFGKVLQQEGFRVVLVDTRYSYVQQARSQGLTAFYADVLSEHVLSAVDFGELGRFLALTPNHDVNALAALRFREVFGRQHVFQLPAATGRPAREERSLHHFVGRFLFRADCTYDQLDEALDRGAMLKVTRLSSEFDYQAFQAHYGTRARLLAVIQGRRLSLTTADAAPAPKPGQAVVSLIEPGTSGPED